MMGVLAGIPADPPVVPLPEPVRRFLDRRQLHPRVVACLELDGETRHWYGSLADLGVADPHWLDALLTGLPPDQDLSMPLVQSPEGVGLSFHQVCEGTRRFLLLQVVGEAWQALQEEQQRAHELALRTRRQDELIRSLEMASRVLLQSEQELKRASQAKELVLGALSHEFGTPLTALLGHLELLEREELPPVARQRVAAVRRGAGHLHTLVQGALDRTRLDRRELRIQTTDIALGALVADVVDLFGPQLSSRGITLQLKVAKGLGVHSDPLRLRQILINLLSNAVKYGGANGRIHIVAQALEEGRRVRLAVRDEGPGLEPAQQQKLFRPYARLKAETQPGHGLGLWIVQQLAHALSLTIGVRSPWDGQRGAEFWIELPAAVRSPASALRRERAGGLGGRRILVIDDDDEVRELLSALLVRQGAEVQAVAGLEREAAQVWARSIDRVLVDLDLGTHGSGLDAIRALRQAGFNGRIVATSADGGQPVAARASAAGATAFIGKPFDFERLFRMLDGNVA